MKLIGLTGGIGSGKSTVAQIFRSLGVPVLDADQQGRWVLRHDEEVVKAVKDLLGEGVYSDGVPDRKQIAALVFNDQALLDALNKIIHPAVKRATEAWWKQLPSDTPYAIKEAAILFESGAAEACNEVITIAAPEAVRMQRVQQRDGAEEEEVSARMSKQWTDDQRADHANYIVDNSGDAALLPQVIAIHQALTN
jgi:dephospho-CoA kinase